MRALVTGGSGFIGSHVVRALLEAGRRVRVLHLPGDPCSNLAGLDVERVPGDLRWDPIPVEGCELVFHLAAVYSLWLPDPGLFEAVNVEGTRRVLQAAARVGARVVHTSSIAVFGGQGQTAEANEDSPFRLGMDHYCCSKERSHRLAEEHGAVIVAPAVPIGPGDLAPTPTGRILVEAARLPVVPVTRGEMNFVDVRDVARWHVLAADRGEAGQSHILGGANHALIDVARAAREVLGRRTVLLELPPRALLPAAHCMILRARLTGRPPPFTPATLAIAELGLRANCSRAHGLLGPPCFAMERSVADALAWFAQAGTIVANSPP